MVRIFLYIIALILLLSSCNQRQIDELRQENENLETEISELKDQIVNLKIENEVLRDNVSNFNEDMEDIQIYARRASANASSAVFWAENGNTFLFKSELESMSDNFDAIAKIASQY